MPRANPRMLFRDVDGSPVPLNPFDQRGTPIVPDNRHVLDLATAARRFDADRLALVVLYCRVMKRVLSGDQLTAMIAEEEEGSQ